MREPTVSDPNSDPNADSGRTADRTPGFRSCDDEGEEMRPTLPRRRLLAVAVPGLLAGCLVESEEGTDGSEDGPASESNADGTGNGDADGDADAEGDADADGASSRQTDDGAESPPDELGPDGSGLVVTDAAVLRVTDNGGETTVRARLTVENAGRFTYGTVEFRVDAYATPPYSGDRDAVGYAYVRREFPSGDRFDDGRRNFEVTIAFDSGESRSRADPDWYDIDAAVRRAEPA